VPSFLGVLKRFGAGDDGHLSFPEQGWTLALDIPVGTSPALAGLLDDFDRRIAECGGRVYFAKDGRLGPGLVGQMYPRLGEWAAVKRRLDPDGILVSDLSDRLRLEPSGGIGQA
jgi:decaprenylphospho-beta-D-ribofuranose 2-oxidase